MFRKITFWLSGGRSGDVKASEGGSCGRSHLHGPEEKKRKKRLSEGQKDNVEQETSTSTNDNTTGGTQEQIEVEIIQLSETQKEVLRASWKVIYSEIGQSLCYVGGTGGAESSSGEHGGTNGSVYTGEQEETESKVVQEHRGVAETFFRLFEEYPQSRAFFGHLGSTSMDTLQSDLRLSRALQEHAVRVMQVVEKVIGRLQNLEKSKKYLLKLGQYHRHTGVPSDYFGVMGTIFLHAVRPYLEKENMWNETVEDAWMELFGHIARVMTYGHTYYHKVEN